MEYVNNNEHKLSETFIDSDKPQDFDNNEHKLNINWMNTDNWPDFDGWCESFIEVTHLTQFDFHPNYENERSRMKKYLDELLKEKKMVGKLTGNIGMPAYKPQQILYFLLASMAQTVCEIGFNAGHSAFQYLSGTRNATVYSFDSGIKGYAKEMAEFLNESYGGRLHMIWGNSKSSIPSFSRKHPNVKCDLLVIDGSHEYSIVMADIINFKEMAWEKNILVMDDIQSSKIHGAFRNAIQAGIVQEIFSCRHKMDLPLHKSFTIAKYVKKKN